MSPIHLKLKKIIIDELMDSTNIQENKKLQELRVDFYLKEIGVVVHVSEDIHILKRLQEKARAFGLRVKLFSPSIIINNPRFVSYEIRMMMPMQV